MKGRMSPRHSKGREFEDRSVAQFMNSVIPMTTLRNHVFKLHNNEISDKHAWLVLGNVDIIRKRPGRRTMKRQ